MISRLRKCYKNVIVDFDDEDLRLLDNKLVDVIAPCLMVIDAIREDQDREELETRLEASKLTAMAPWIVVEKDANGKQTGKTGDGASEIKPSIAEYPSLPSFENRIGKGDLMESLAGKEGLESSCGSVYPILYKRPAMTDR